MFHLNPLTPPKTSENQRFSDVFRERRIETLVENGLIEFFYSEYEKEFVICLVQHCLQLHIYMKNTRN